MATWNNGFCDLCGEPGGCLLCARACCCPCTIIGDITKHVGGPGGFMGGCLATLCGFGECWMCFIAPQVAKEAGFEESGIKACCCTICCGLCYTLQVWRQAKVNADAGK